MIRLNKYLAENTSLSRRDADKAVADGRVTVNGEVAEGPWVQVDETSEVTLDGAKVGVEDYFYWAFYKPVKIVTAYGDGQGKETLDVFPKLAEKKPAYSGRLDYDSEGLIIFSNDGDFIRKLQKSDEKIQKEYIVSVTRRLHQAQIDELKRGITYEGIDYLPCIVTETEERRYRVILYEGKKRQIRNMFRHFNIQVKRLKRVRIGRVNLDGMKAGEMRVLSKKDLEGML
ncbi:pseudouridine synthase [Seleniivibrio sp.]|uniref:pseudouridine synthase n=1 Tax=Seleniivibrio sp. TaxID=2898801 RepID=UPI0025E77AD9|nr:pseudouridine synthase [Seleniivibrio sp.]MCD8553311.1 pseudouridine synthase [Seleniivibrio sp.]